jgi:uncharacterized protein (TIGR03084 family)
MQSLCADLAAEHAELDSLVAGLADADWSRETPSPGWHVRDQISHLWFFDQRALLALTDTDGFADDKRWLTANGGTDASIAPGRSIQPQELLQRWRADRGRMLDAASRVNPADRIPWYGPAMAARSFVTARLMETWAHGQDVADALGVSRQSSERLRHVAHIGVLARPFSYALRGMTIPDVDIAVRLVGPNGELWEWGDSDDEVVSGSALDFCLVVTQRRHRADTELIATGDAAVEWVAIAQAFAGAPGASRHPGQFRTTDRRSS